MAIVCPSCGMMVHVSCGYIVRHGSRNHLKFEECCASGSPYPYFVGDSSKVSV